MSSSSHAPARRRSRGRRSRAAGTDDRPAVPRAAWTRLAACTAAAALLQLDGTLITVALPKVADGLRVSGGSTSVVLSAYFGAYALLLIPGGEFVDRFGARRLALSGLALFALGAVAGALSQTFPELIIARIVQGAGAGLVSPAALAGAVSGFPPERRGAALGIWGASAGTSNLIGPLLGGLLTVTLGWRADWWALVPLTLAAAIAVARAVPANLHDDRGATGGAAAREASPGAHRIVAAATLIAGLTFAVMIGAFYIAEQYLQRTAHFSALGASSALVIVALLVGGAAPLAGRLVDSRGERLATVLGFLGAGIGLVVLGLPGVPLSNLFTVLPLIPVGLGLGMLFVPVSRAALNATPEASHGRTSALLSAGRLLGAAVGAGLAGIALSGSLTASVVHQTLLVGAGICLVIGLPGALCLRPGGASEAAPAAA
ncbi:MAG TPA: MFS transporter [Solirubrobacteraceae bacterium]|nr:MFS transporter [Solirubrobacteraceae bacterium]